jgi:hypothetical protein
VPLALLRADVVLHCGLVSGTTAAAAAAATAATGSEGRAGNTNAASASWQLLQLACSGLPHCPAAYVQTPAATAAATAAAAAAANGAAAVAVYAETAQSRHFHQLIVAPVDLTTAAAAAAVAAAAVANLPDAATYSAATTQQGAHAKMTDEDAVKARVLRALLLLLPAQAPVDGVPYSRWLPVPRQQQQHTTGVQQQALINLKQATSKAAATGRTSSEASARRCLYR